MQEPSDVHQTYEEYTLLKQRIRELEKQEADRACAEEQHESEFPYKLLFTDAAEGILVFMVRTKHCIAANPAVCRMFGHTEEDMLQLGLEDIFSGESMQRLTVKFEAVVLGEKTFLPDLLCRRKDGSLFYADIRSTSIIIDGEKCNLGFLTDVTDRRQAEMALRDREQQFSQIINNIPGLVARVDRDLHFTFANREFERLYGIPPETMIGRPIAEVLGEEPFLYGLPYVKRVMEGELVTFEYRFKNREGKLVYTLLTFIPDFGPDGMVRGYFSVAIDITELKKTEMELSDREQQLSQIINNMPGRIARIDQDLRFIFANSEYERMLGLLPEAMLGHTIAEVLGDELFQNWLPYVRRVMDGEVVTFESQAKNRVGETIYSLINFIPDYSPDGMVRGFFDIGLDIGVLKQTEETLRESQIQLMETQRLARIGRCEIDLLTGKITWSDEVFRIFEKDSKQFDPSYESLLSAAHPADRALMDAAYKRCRETGEAYKLVYRLLFPYSRIKYLYEEGQIFSGPEGEPLRLVVIIQDITELKQAEEEKKNLALQLTQAQKMESVGRLAGGVAHDFNNMLSVIIGGAQLVMDKMNPADPLYKLLLDILNAGKRSADLTRQLLAFARKQAVHPRVLNFNDTLSGMLKMLQRLIGENIELVWAPGKDLWRIKFDPSQVDQLLANLAVNARDAIDKTGKIIIKTANVTCDVAYCAVHPECVPGEYVLLSVSDDGCGMDKDTLDKIFEPFFTTKKESQGTGLGLSTVYGIVKQNGGFINVDSAPGLGTTFKIYIPRHADEELEIRENKRTMKILGGTETILVVEDEPAVLKLSTDMLESLGYKALAAQNRDQVFQLIENYRGRIDLLLIDVVMPGMNGKELSEKILSMKPDLKHLYMSGYTADVIARQGILEEGVKLILKPFSLNELAVKVRDALES